VGSRIGGTWRKGVSCQAMAVKSGVSWSTSAWRCGLSHWAAVSEIAVLRHLAPGSLEVVALSDTCPPLGNLAAVSPSYWTL